MVIIALSCFRVTRRMPDLQVRLAVEGRRERHVVKGSGHAVGAAVRLHALDAVLGLIWRQFAAQLIGQDVRLVAGQNAERVNDLEEKWPIKPFTNTSYNE